MRERREKEREGGKGSRKKWRKKRRGSRMTCKARVQLTALLLGVAAGVP